MNSLRDQSVLMLGLGASGLAMARWCVRAGARVTVWDTRDAPPMGQALALEVPEARLMPWAPEGTDLARFQLILKSPGLSPRDPRVAAVLTEATDAAIAVIGELDLFVQALAALKTERGYLPKLIAITGTNGKTTTTAMTALLVARAGKRVAVAGNIGPSLLDVLAGCLDAELSGTPLPEVWVLELSSFQLEGGANTSHGVRGFEPDAAVVLNLTQDHLDWHGTLEAYARAKARVFGSQGTVVLNRDDAAVMALLDAPAAAAAAGKSKARPAARPVPRHTVHFGTTPPAAPGDFGIVQTSGMAWLVRALPLEDGVKPRRSTPHAAPVEPGEPGEAHELHLQHLMPADALRVRGRHNAANALAALALATAVGCALGPMLHALRDYRGEPHRVQWLGDVAGVAAYDDSKGTNVGATVAAIDGLGADIAPQRLVLILGGDGKGQEFAPLAAPLARHARAVALIGRDAALIEAALADVRSAEGHALPMARHASLEAAVAWCFAQAQVGDAVLLSPACASLDMFSDYKHRAAVFADAVQALQDAAVETPA